MMDATTILTCSAAAMAVAAALPQTRENERFTLLAVVGVTLLSTVAMVLYPLVMGTLHMSPIQSGVFLGATIHDVAQVVAAGSLLGPETRDTSTIVKLFRVAMLAPVVVVVSIFARGSMAPIGRRPPIVPAFLLGFCILVIFSSLGWLEQYVREVASSASRALLVIAIAAAGMRTRLNELVQLGWRPILLLITETVFLALVMLALLQFGL